MHTDLVSAPSSGSLLNRGVEVFVSAILFVVMLPVFAMLALAIRVNSSGPVVLAQPRIGRHGVPFNCYKLRTMHVGAPVAPTHVVGDSHYTPIGRILRKTGLDELPQLWNVLNGSMRLVGPRPCLPSQLELIEARRRHGILDLHPGITGLAQAEGIDMSDEARLIATELVYVRRQSTAMDAHIILKTVLLLARKCVRLFRVKP